MHAQIRTDVYRNHIRLHALGPGCMHAHQRTKATATAHPCALEQVPACAIASAIEQRIRPTLHHAPPTKTLTPVPYESGSAGKNVKNVTACGQS